MESQWLRWVFHCLDWTKDFWNILSPGENLYWIISLWFSNRELIFSWTNYEHNIAGKSLVWYIQSTKYSVVCLLVKRSNMGLLFQGRRIKLEEMLSLLSYAWSCSAKRICVQRAGHLLCSKIQPICLCPEEELVDFQTWIIEFPASQELIGEKTVMLHIFSVRSSNKITSYFGIIKLQPLYSQPMTTPFKFIGVC